MSATRTPAEEEATVESSGVACGGRFSYGVTWWDGGSHLEYVWGALEIVDVFYRNDIEEGVLTPLRKGGVSFDACRTTHAQHGGRVWGGCRGGLTAGAATAPADALAVAAAKLDDMPREGIVDVDGPTWCGALRRVDDVPL